jgi:NADPH-dependent glutamate synthase beta subunit-like oxidoreductase
MAVKKVKKKKKKFGARTFSGGSREMSPERPRHVEKKPPCHATCPSGNHIRKFLTTLAQAEHLGKAPTRRSSRPGRSIRTPAPFRPYAVGCAPPRARRSATARGWKERSASTRSSGSSATTAVIGAGPSGFSCAYQLARRGYGVTILEALDKPGGMLRWGIPGYRLPEEVLDGEIGKILDLGVELKCGVKVGKDLTLDDLRKSYDAVYVALGAQQGVTLGVDGEDAPNVFSGVDFLSRFHHGEKLDLGKDVVVIIVGGGDTAIDAARICKRLGANVTILYRRTRKEMPAIDEEVDEAINEGIIIEFLAAPIGFRKENGLVAAMRAIRMELGEPDASGRRRPVPIEGSEFEIPASAVISAVSQAPDFSGFETLIEGRDWVKVDGEGATKVDGVWAGGDVIALDLVTTAVGHGRRAAEAIDRTFTGAPADEDKRELIPTDRMLLDHYTKTGRHEPVALDLEERMSGMDVEVNLGLTEAEAIDESRRCMSCGYCFDCEKCWMYCQDSAIDKPMEKGALYIFKLENCTGCRKCAEVCPCGFIDMV